MCISIMEDMCNDWHVYFSMHRYNRLDRIPWASTQKPASHSMWCRVVCSGWITSMDQNHNIHGAAASPSRSGGTISLTKGVQTELVQRRPMIAITTNINQWWLFLSFESFRVVVLTITSHYMAISDANMTAGWCWSLVHGHPLTFWGLSPQPVRDPHFITSVFRVVLGENGETFQWICSKPLKIKPVV